MTLLLPLIQRSFFHSTRRIQKPWLVTAYDATDVQALERRLSVREQHLAQAKLGFENGKVLAGGAIMNDDDTQMIGSMLILDYDNIEQVENHIAEDPYTKAKVWKRVDIRPLRLARLKE